MKILAIETSCDETAVAVVEGSGGFENLQFSVLGDTVLSQAMKHAKFGGVYPNLAKREHSKNLIPVLKKTLTEANMLHNSDTKKAYSSVRANIGISLEREPELLWQFEEFIPTIEKPDIDAIAVTQGPGLEPALWVGLNFAKALSLVWNLPLIPVNHMEGHIMSVLLDRNKTASSKPQKIKNKLEFPVLALLISGGHTELVLNKDWLDYEILGQTRDDAVGEAFDKVARMLGLTYPGGPEISKQASIARQNNIPHTAKLPRPMINTPDYDFSFSGLKTAVLTLIKDRELTEEEIQDIAREFEDSVVEVLVKKTQKALESHNIKTLIIGGGVIANKRLQESFEALIEQYTDTQLLIPQTHLTGDNAVMIGMSGYLQTLKKQKNTTDDLYAKGNLKLATK